MSSARSITDYVTHPHLPVPAPRYRRTGLKTGIVHVGVGGFHRAHEAMFIDRLLAEGAADDWAICGVGVLPVDRRMRDVLRAQDGLYTLLLRHPDGIEEARIIGSLVEHIVVPDDPDAVIERIAHPDTRILSLTITEGGYCLDPVTGGFDASAAGVAADLADPEHPATVFGLVTEALRRRRERGVGGLTMMSCDNLPGNGTVARRSFVSFARLRDPALADWIESAVSFPNSMVDRITPATTPADVEHVRERYGIDDAWPVVAEPFVQWVIEDHFVAGRPPFERAGAQLVEDVIPYELMKLRLLNASHQALAYVGALADFEYVHDAMAEPVVVDFVRAYMAEARETLPPVPGIDLDAYCRTVVERFGNPHVRDTIARLATDTSDRIPKFVLPTVRELLDQGRSPRLGAAVLASWAQYARGVSDSGRPIVVVDPARDRVMAAAAEDDELGFLGLDELFGDLAAHPAFVEPYLSALRALRRSGALGGLRDLLAGSVA